MLSVRQVATLQHMEPAKLGRLLRRGWYRQWYPKRVGGRWRISRKRYMRWRRQERYAGARLESFLKQVYAEPLWRSLVQESDLMDLFKPEKRYPEAFGL